ncbi:MAG TPA: pentapeptide repeat-containing protein [Nitrososphaera sp.]
MLSRRLPNLLSKHKKTAITTIFGLILGPIIGYLIIESITITPSDLVRDLENGDISKFNEERKQLKQQIVFDGMDLSDKDLEGANLDSVIILHSNLSNTNLQNSDLENAQISGDLSRIDLRNANLLNADLRGANLFDA